MKQKIFSKILLTALLASHSLLAAPNKSPTVQASNEFGIEIFKSLVETKKTENVFYSPISTSQALTLLYAGSSGKTQQNLAEGLKLDSALSAEDVLTSARNDLKAITQNSDPKNGLVLSIANSVWGNEGNFEFKKSYLEDVKGYLNAEARTLDFSQKQSAGVINDWASKNTQGKIKKVIDSDALQAQVAVLMNASYFKGDWTYPFEKRLTKDAEFKSVGNTVLTVKMMDNGFAGKPLRIDTNRTYEAVELPYGYAEVPEASLVIIKPWNWQQFTNNLTAATLERAIHTLAQQEIQSVQVQIPKFTFEAEYNLVPAVQMAGITEIFGAGADFSALSATGRFQVSLIKQNTFVAVDEKGTEAAAVTTIGLERTSIPREADKKFVADKPFLAVIKSNTTGAILFVGAILHPQVK